MLSHSHNNGNLLTPQHNITTPLPGLSSPVSVTVGQLNKDVEEDDVFMQLELPLERDSGSGSSSDESGKEAPSSGPRTVHLQFMYIQVWSLSSVDE